MERFVIARNPAPRTRLPYLLRLPPPEPGGRPLLLATQGRWPGPRDLFCCELESWPEGAQVLAEIPVQACYRRGRAVHLVLARRSHRRSLFVWTQRQGRTLVFWRSPRSVQAARPGIRVPQARALERELTVAVDTRERYPWRLSGRPGVTVERRTLPVGDYAVFDGERLVAAVERKTPEELVRDAVSGRLQFLLAELEALPRGALVVEGRLSDLFKRAERVRPGWLLNTVAALQATYPRVPWLFAETSKLAAELAFRWLAASLRAERSRARGVPLLVELGLAGPPPGEGGVRAEPLRAGEDRAAYVARCQAPPDREARLATAAQSARAGRVWTVRAYAEAFGVSAATAASDLKELVRRGVLRGEGRTRGRRYLAAGPGGPGGQPTGRGDGVGGARTGTGPEEGG